MSLNLDTAIKRLLGTFEYVFQRVFNLEDITIAHKHGNSCTSCGPNCLKSPFQGENMDICGLACLIAAMIFSEYSENLLDKSHLLDNLSWVTELDKCDVFVRKYFICSFMKNCIDFSLLYPKGGELNSVICNLDARTDEIAS